MDPGVEQDSIEVVEHLLVDSLHYAISSLEYAVVNDWSVPDIRRSSSSRPTICVNHFGVSEATEMLEDARC